MNFDNETIEQQLAICEAATQGPLQCVNNTPLVVSFNGAVVFSAEKKEDAICLVMTRNNYLAALKEIQRLRAVLSNALDQVNTNIACCVYEEPNRQASWWEELKKILEAGK